jgi:PAS domain S-box-containing protein
MRTAFPLRPNKQSLMREENRSMKDEDRPKAVLIEELNDLRRRVARTEKAEGRDELKILMASILDAIPCAVIGLRDRTIVFANDGVRLVFGLDPEALIGRTTRVLYRSDEEFEEIARLFYPALEKDRIHTERFACRRSDGSDILCLVSASRVGESLTNRMIVASYSPVTC